MNGRPFAGVCLFAGLLCVTGAMPVSAQTESEQYPSTVRPNEPSSQPEQVPQAAESSASTAVEDSETYELKFSRALVEFGKERYDQAEIYFRQALAAKPNDLEASAYLGQALLRQGKLDEAETTFRDMIDVNPEAGKAWLGVGMVQYTKGQYKDALLSLKAAERFLPNDPLVYYYQGLAFHQLEDFDNSPGRFLRAMTLSPDLAPTAQYYSGVAYFRRGVMDEARTSFEAALASQPEGEQAKIARELLAQVPSLEQPSPRRWGVSANVGAEYDTNVVLLPGGTQPPGGSTGISRQKDYRTVLNANLDYRFVQDDKWTMGIAYGIYQSFHRTLSGFDVEDHSPRFFIERQFGPLRIAGQYIYNYTLVGRSPYLISHTGQTVWTLTETKNTFTQFQFRYQNKDFQDGRFLLNSARDGKNWLVGATQYLIFADGNGRARLGYTFDTDVTGGGSPVIAGLPGTPDNADWDYQGHRLSTGVELPPIYTLNLDLAFDFYRQNYSNPNTNSVNGLIKRRDNIYAFTGTLGRDVNKYVSAALQYSYTRDENNLQVFDYNRSIFALILTGTF